MASQPHVPVKDEHLHEAVVYAFGHSDEVLVDVKKALTEQSERASKTMQRRHVLTILDRFVLLQTYWSQLQRDWQNGPTDSPKNVKTFIDTVRDAAYQRGYDKGLEDGGDNLADNEAYAEGYSDGYDCGNEAVHTPRYYGALGFGLCLILVLALKLIAPSVF